MSERYICKICKIDFPTESELKKHTKEAHGM
ncbi:MAG: C2H2-type zinc finger protein [Nitrososphaerota archaeon]